jgi:hypothetical protein
MNTFSPSAVLAATLLFNLPVTTSRAQDEIKAEFSKPDAAPSETQPGEDLASRAIDPTASLMALNFQGTYTGGFYGEAPGLPNDAWSLTFRPAIPFNFLDHPNLLRVTVPYQLSGRGQEGFGPISVFDLFMFNHSWGRWGLGPLMNFDTTGDLTDEFSMGPAVGAVANLSKKLKVGLFSQNLFAGDTAISQIQPVIAYQLGDGWAISAGDLQFAYDWKASQWLSAPVGFQIGKVTKIGSQPVRFALNPQYNLIDRDGLNEWSLTFTFTALFPTH